GCQTPLELEIELALAVFELARPLAQAELLLLRLLGAAALLVELRAQILQLQRRRVTAAGLGLAGGFLQLLLELRAHIRLHFGMDVAAQGIRNRKPVATGGTGDQ